MRNYITRRAGVWLIEGDWLNAEDAEEEDRGVALQRVPCGWRFGTSIAAQSGGDACGTGGETPSSGLRSQLVPPAVQYACDQYQRLLRSHGAVPSMSRRGNCYDNAVPESFWGRLKTELIYGRRFATRQQAKRAIFEYIEVFYNRQRLQSTLGYQGPEQFVASRS